MEERNITCIVCPLGCQMTARLENGEVTGVSGNTCKRGEGYAISEITDPRRTLTTTIRVVGGSAPLVSVKTDVPVPKALLFACMQQVGETQVQAPVQIGDVLVASIAGTEANIVATSAASCYNGNDETDGQRDGSGKRASSSQLKMAAV